MKSKSIRAGARGVGVVITALLATTVFSSGAAATERPVIEACRAGDSALTAARTDLSALDARLAALKPGEVAGFTEALARLLSLPCFALSAEDSRRESVLSARSASAMRAWWRGGGYEWLSSYLRADTRGRIDPVVIPPDFPSSIVPGDQHGVGAASFSLQWACATNAPADCGAETRGFRHRAERALAQQTQPAKPSPCRQGDYAAWRGCQEQQRKRSLAFPVGETRSPRDGWLIVQTSSGNACRETNALHVDSGSLHRLRSCGAGLQTAPADATYMVPTGFARELAWMTFQVELLRFQQSRAVLVKLPGHLVPRARAKTSATAAGHSEGGAHDVIASWLWWSGGRTIAGSTLNVARTPGADEVMHLLDVVAASAVLGPVTQSLPVEVRALATSALQPPPTNR